MNHWSHQSVFNILLWPQNNPTCSALGGWTSPCMWVFLWELEVGWPASPLQGVQEPAFSCWTYVCIDPHPPLGAEGESLGEGREPRDAIYQTSTVMKWVHSRLQRCGRLIKVHWHQRHCKAKNKSSNRSGRSDPHPHPMQNTESTTKLNHRCRALSFLFTAEINFFSPSGFLPSFNRDSWRGRKGGQRGQWHAA